MKNFYNASIGISSAKHDIRLALDIIKKSPNLKMFRMVEKPDGEQVVEVRGMRDDIKEFRSQYATALREKLEREEPNLTYDQIKSRIII